jgi:predicted nuclease of predicted toxin-antitoxin system
MRFLVDAQLPPALARWISSRGYDAAHVADKGMQAATDRLIWEYALTDGWVIVTKDEDFAQRKILLQTGPEIVWIRWPNTRRQELLIRFEVVLPAVVAALARGETLIEVV